jgi:probable rRNA maturation factor
VSDDSNPVEFHAELDDLVVEIVVQPAAAAAVDKEMQGLMAMAIMVANEIAGPASGAVTVLVDDDARVRSLNRRWRGIDRPTNVLSFSYPAPQPAPAKLIGDLAISCETAAREAAMEGKTLTDHLVHLSVHGFLHLLGYDHESDADAEAMERLERTILARVEVPDPYPARHADA